MPIGYYCRRMGFVDWKREVMKKQRPSHGRDADYERINAQCGLAERKGPFSQVKQGKGEGELKKSLALLRAFLAPNQEEYWLETHLT